MEPSINIVTIVFFQRSFSHHRNSADGGGHHLYFHIPTTSAPPFAFFGGAIVYIPFSIVHAIILIDYSFGRENDIVFRADEMAI
jgi:hypothetical protein